jgi:hypothetical protein
VVDSLRLGEKSLIFLLGLNECLLEKVGVCGIPLATVRGG